MKNKRLKNKLIELLDCLNEFETVDNEIFELVKKSHKSNYELLKKLV